MSKDDKIHAELEALVTKVISAIETRVEDTPLFLALDFARENLARALDDVRDAAFGIVDHKNTKGRHASTLKVAEAKLDRVGMRYAQELAIYQRFEALAKAAVTKPGGA